MSFVIGMMSLYMDRLLIPTFASEPDLTTTEVTSIQGDVDGDGNVTLIDAQLALKAALGIITLSEKAFWAADLNDENKITLSNAQIILKTAIGIVSIGGKTTPEPQDDDVLFEEPTPTQSTDVILMVKGKDITDGNYVRLNYEHRYAELPLTAVVKALGAEVEWQSTTTAKITFDGKDYILDTTKGSLIEVGGYLNILVVAPGSQHGTYYQVIGDEFVIDSDSTLLLVNNMGAKIKIDYEKGIVNIK